MLLVGQNITLREIIESDWKDVHTYSSLPIVCKFQPWGPNTKDDSIDFVKQAVSDAKQLPRERFVFVINLNGKIIGASEITIRDFIDQKGEIGYVVNPSYWGHGYATEAATLLVQFGFEKLGLHRIYATCDPRNIGSIKVLEKIGMIREGTIRDDFLLKGGWRDSHIYGILEHEWNPSEIKIK